MGDCCCETRLGPAARLYPVLDPQARHPGELAGVVGDEGCVFSQRVAGNPQVVGADRRACGLQACRLLRVMATNCRAHRVMHRYQPSQPLQPTQHLRLAGAALRALEQLGPGNERHAQAIVVMQGIDALSKRRRLVLEQVNQDVGIEQVDQSASRSCMGRASC